MPCLDVDGHRAWQRESPVDRHAVRGYDLPQLFVSSPMVKRAVIVAKIKPNSEQEVAKIFAESDATELPGLVGVRHRSLFVLDDVYVHLIEMDDEFEGAVD